MKKKLCFFSLTQYFFIHVLTYLFICSSTQAYVPRGPQESYYGKFLFSMITKKVQHTENFNFKKIIHEILNQTHYPNDGQFDELDPLPERNLYHFHTRDCSSHDQSCFVHTPISYEEARKVILLEFFFDKKTSSITDVYCNYSFPNSPTSLPSHLTVNVEHAWPQSRFSKSSHTASIQKSDLHHLFPVPSWINSTRSNLPYGEGQQTKIIPNCPNSALAIDDLSGKKVFSPPTKHRGNVARAMFYFAVKYNQKISPVEEMTLRNWHLQDPVDEKERSQMERIFQLQKTRNPFIDYPHLVSLIEDF
jgi:hypothetical protein